MKYEFQRPFHPPSGAKDVILVRHGAVDAPEPDGLIGGRSDPPLNESGRAQAAAVADRLRNEPVAALFVTPLARTTETAEALGTHLGLAPVVVPELNEVHLGEWEGHGIAARGAAADPEFVDMMQRSRRWDVIPGAEPHDQFAARVRDGLEVVAEAARDNAIVVAVTHAGVIDELLCQITGADGFAFINCANGSLTRVVRMPDGRWNLLTFNDTVHLAAAR